MALHRRAPRRDTVEHAIVQTLRRCGWTWEPHSRAYGPDGFAAKAGRTVAIEIKTGSRMPSAKQTAWRAAWRGETAILRTVEDALALNGRETR